VHGRHSQRRAQSVPELRSRLEALARVNGEGILEHTFDRVAHLRATAARRRPLACGDGRKVPLEGHLARDHLHDDER
jgi:hypothetical protein